jgi:hypothetical protein
MIYYKIIKIIILTIILIIYNKHINSLINYNNNKNKNSMHINGFKIIKINNLWLKNNKNTYYRNYHQYQYQYQIINNL